MRKQRLQRLKQRRARVARLIYIFERAVARESGRFTGRRLRRFAGVSEPAEPESGSPLPRGPQQARFWLDGVEAKSRSDRGPQRARFSRGGVGERGISNRE